MLTFARALIGDNTLTQFFKEIWKREFWIEVTKIAIGTALGGSAAIVIVILGIMFVSYFLGAFVD